MTYVCIKLHAQGAFMHTLCMKDMHKRCMKHMHKPAVDACDVHTHTLWHMHRAHEWAPRTYTMTCTSNTWMSTYTMSYVKHMYQWTHYYSGMKFQAPLDVSMPAVLWMSWNFKHLWMFRCLHSCECHENSSTSGCFDACILVDDMKIRAPLDVSMPAFLWMTWNLKHLWMFRCLHSSEWHENSSTPGSCILVNDMKIQAPLDASMPAFLWMTWNLKHLWLIQCLHSCGWH
jgi:hypothetical protein